jgi:hypothetical protein
VPALADDGDEEEPGGNGAGFAAPPTEGGAFGD